MVDLHVIFSLEAILVSLGIGAGGFLLAVIVRAVAFSDGAGDSALRGLEAFLLGTVGAFAAHTFVYLMMAAGHHSGLAVTVTGLFFFIWPGLINVVSELAVHHPVITEHGTLIFALVVGGAVGVMDGLWAIHDWKGWGWLAFPLDITWGLSGSTNGVLIHLIDFAWAGHRDGSDVDRNERHLYDSGFRIEKKSIFSQGSVITNAQYGTSNEFNHESVHGWQNRVLGPFFWMTYIAWMLLFLLPALFVGLGKGKTGLTIRWWTYENNPWEVMAYTMENKSVRDNDDGHDESWLLWNGVLVGILGALVLGGAAAGIVVLFVKAY
jgi:hypothetical protein